MANNNLVEIVTLVVAAITLIVSLVAAVLNYRLEKQKKHIEYLEKNYSIAIENMQACYEIEGYMAERLKTSRNQLQNDLRKWLKKNKLNLYRTKFCPSFFEKEQLKLRK